MDMPLLPPVARAGVRGGPAFLPGAVTGLLASLLGAAAAAAAGSWVSLRAAGFGGALVGHTRGLGSVYATAVAFTVMPAAPP